MFLEANLPRWVYASAGVVFKQRVNGALPVFFEGQDHTLKNNESRLEFRLDGPYVNKLTMNEYRVDAEINILVVTFIKGNDVQLIHRDCGVALQFFAEAIPIHKYGDGPYDDQSYLGCMTLVRAKDARDYVRVSHFGKSDPTKPLLQASVEGHFSFLLNTR